MTATDMESAWMLSPKAVRGMICVACSRFGITTEQFFGGTRHRRVCRTREVLSLALRNRGMSKRWIAATMLVDRTTVNSALARAQMKSGHRDRCVVAPAGDCVLSPGCRSRTGYAHDYVDGIEMPAHRAAWVRAFGPIPAGLFVCHKCDNRACVNPAHLFLGTNADNMADMVSKGRSPRGERSGSSVLGESQVIAILGEAGTDRAVAAKYGVSKTCIQRIRAGTAWTHIDRNAIVNHTQKGAG